MSRNCSLALACWLCYDGRYYFTLLESWFPMDVQNKQTLNDSAQGGAVW